MVRSLLLDVFLLSLLFLLAPISFSAQVFVLYYQAMLVPTLVWYTLASHLCRFTRVVPQSRSCDKTLTLAGTEMSIAAASPYALPTLNLEINKPLLSHGGPVVCAAHPTLAGWSMVSVALPATLGLVGSGVLGTCTLSG